MQKNVVKTPKISQFLFSTLSLLLFNEAVDYFQSL